MHGFFLYFLKKQSSKTLYLLLVSYSLLASCSDYETKGFNPIPVFKEFSAGSERKESFFNFIIPMANKINASVLQDRQRFLNIDMKADSDDLIWLEKQAGLYLVKDFDAKNIKDRIMLKNKMDVIPLELVLAQAANGSAWGPSRFARKA